MNPEERNSTGRKLWDAASRWATFVTLLIAILGYGIGDHQLLQKHDAIITTYESHGTPQAVKLQTQADEKFRSIERRLELLEQIVITIPDLRVELVRVSSKLDSINSSLDRHMTDKPK